MTISYADGQTLKAALVTRDENRVRVAFPGAEDVAEFTQINDTNTWISEDCEAVQIDFHGPRQRPEPVYSDADFICPQALAAKLIHLLLNEGQPGQEMAAALNFQDSAPANRLVV